MYIYIYIYRFCGPKGTAVLHVPEKTKEPRHSGIMSCVCVL